MTNTAAPMFRGAATTTLTTTLYTVPTLTTAVVTNIVITNDAATDATATIKIDGFSIVPGTTVSANSILALDIRQVAATGKLIKGGASATTVNFHISGMEIT